MISHLGNNGHQTTLDGLFYQYGFLMANFSFNEQIYNICKYNYFLLQFAATANF